MVATAAPTLTDASPDSAWTGNTSNSIYDDTTLSLTGTGFQEVPSLTFINVDDPEMIFEAPYVVWNSSLSASSICPAESEAMPPGFYFVLLENLDGGSAFWATGGVLEEFEVTDIDPPDIEAVDPFRSPAADTVVITITGTGFMTGAVVRFLTGGAPITITPGSVTATKIVLNLPGNTLSQGIYPVQVVNPNDQSDTYYYYGATPSSAGHLDGFTFSGKSLVTPRWRHASVEGFDPWLGSYIYTAGGIDAADTVIGEVEILPVAIDGTPGNAWVAQQWGGSKAAPRTDNDLETARNGHSLVRAGHYLFAIGGTTANTTLALDGTPALSTIERAVILGTMEQPVIAGASSLGGSGVPEGTWYYQVTAVNDDPLTGWGESLPSSPRMVQGSGQFLLEWDPVDGATSYNVYRNVNIGGDQGLTRLLVAGIAGTTYTDDGTDTVTVADALPLARGSLGRWHIEAEELLAGREGLDAIVLAIYRTSLKIYLYAFGGRPSASATGYLATGERTVVNYDGTLAGFVPMTNDMTTARAFYPLITNQGQDAFVGPGNPELPPILSGDLYLMALLGDNSYNESGAGNSGMDTFEVCSIITVNGDNTPWILQNESHNKDVHGGEVQLFFDYMFIFDGVKTEQLGYDPSPHGSAAQRFTYIEGGYLDDPADIFYDSQATGANFADSRTYYSSLRLNGFVWLIAGNGGGGPIGTIEWTPN